MATSAPKLRIAVTLEQCWHRVPGGTARAALDTVSAIAAQGTVEQVGVAAWHPGPPREPWIPSIPVGMLGIPRLALYESWHRFRWPSVDKATGSIDVIHVTGLAMPPRHVPIVATLHDLAFRRFPDYFTRRGLRFFDAAMTLMRRDADVVLCSSEATFADAVDAGFDPARLRVVPLGVAAPPPDAPELGPARLESLRRRLGLKGRYVVHLGTVEPRKNTAALVRVAPSLPDDVQVVLAGGQGWGDTGTPDATASEGDVARVVRAGFVSESDKWALLAGAAACAVPSLWEGFGLPVLEAMAVGTPVVTSQGTALAEVVGDAGICVDPRDDAALRAGLLAVLDDEPRALEMAERGRERAATFTWERTATAVLDACAEVAGR